MPKALQTKDWASVMSKVMDAHMVGYITRTKLKSVSSTLPEIKAIIDETMDFVFEATSKLMEGVQEFQETLPTDGSIAEGAGNEAVIQTVRTGTTLIRKGVGLMEGAF